MKHLNVLPGMLLCAVLLTAGAHAQTTATSAAAREALAKQPLSFMENRGQWHPDARFLARLNGLDLWVTDQGFVYDLYRMDRKPSENTIVRSGHVVNMRFLGAGTGARARGAMELPGTFNYFIGKDRSRWAANVHRYGGAEVRNIYPGIDAVLYADGESPRYDLVVAPGADPAAVRIAYDGAEGIRIEPDGDLVISTSAGTLTQHGLFAYQMVNGERRGIECSFRLDHPGTVGFEVGAYDPKLPLVIDPIIYSTYAGGSNWDEARAVALDTSTSNVKIYLAGFTYSSNFPTSSGSYQATYTGDAGGAPPGGDAFVMKLDPQQPAANQIVWATYIGSDDNDAATDMAVDGAGNVYITGITGTAFPTTNVIVPVTTTGIFVTKLNTFGSALTYSTYIADQAAGSIPRMVLDANNRVYVTGATASTGFPATSGAYQASLRGGSDAFVALLDAAGENLIYATYLGGTGNDVGRAISLNALGNITVTGITESGNFPLIANQAYDTTYNGGTDIFVARLDPDRTDATQLLYSSYFGGTDYDDPSDVVVNPFDDIVVIGTTTSADFPTRNALQNTYGGGDATVGDAFLMKINPAAAPAAQILYSTYLGGAGADMATSITCDRNGIIHVTGWTGSASFPVTGNAVDTSFGGDSADAFVARFGLDGEMMYSTFLGGSAGDRGYDLAIGRQQTIFVTGHTLSSNFPTAGNAYQSSIRSTTHPDIFLTQFSILEVTSPNGGESLCAGTSATITWTGGTGTNYDIYISSDSGHVYNPLAFNVSQTSYTWLIPMDYPAGSKYFIKIKHSASAEYDVSDSAFTINAKPIVIRNPANATQVEGGSASFTADATGVPEPTVAWQYNAGAGWVTVPNETQKTLTVTNITAAQKGTQYRAVFTNSCGSVNTEVAVLDVTSILVTNPNGGEEFCAGTTQTITWSAQSTSGPFDVFLSSNAGGEYNSIATGVTGTSFDWAIPSSLSGVNFRIQVRIGNSQAMDASDSNFTINQPAIVLRSPASVTATEGSSASFVAEGNGYPFPDVRWEVNTGSGWVPVENVSVGSLVLQNVQTSQNGNRYRAIFMNMCGADTTDEALLTVTPPAGVDNHDVAEALRLAVAPNPVAGDGMIRFTLPRADRVELTITDMRGRIVAHPLDAVLGAGDHAVPFDAATLPNGSYVVGITAGTRQETLKITIAR